MKRNNGTIYAIAAQGTSWVKIGSTTGDAADRVRSLQGGQPFRLKVLAEVPVTASLREIEQQVHTFLAEKRGMGEWFAVDMDQPTLAVLVARAARVVLDTEKAHVREEQARMSQEYQEAEEKRLRRQAEEEQTRQRVREWREHYMTCPYRRQTQSIPASARDTSQQTESIPASAEDVEREHQRERETRLRALVSSL